MKLKVYDDPFKSARIIMDDDLAIKYATYYKKKNRLKNQGRVAYKDSTKSKFYDAERRFEKKWPCTIKFNSINEAQKYAKRVCKSKLWVELTQSRGYKNVIIVAKKLVKDPATAGTSWGYKIQLDQTCGFDQYVLLHELAHSAGYMHHDVSYRKVLLRLVSRFMGVDAAKLLKSEIKKAGLKMIIKNIPIKTPKQWLIDYNKMADMRKLIK